MGAKPRKRTTKTEVRTPIEFTVLPDGQVQFHASPGMVEGDRHEFVHDEDGRLAEAWHVRPR